MIKCGADESKKRRGKLENWQLHLQNVIAAMMGTSLKMAAWKSRVERKEGCADKKWHKELQERTGMLQ